MTNQHTSLSVGRSGELLALAGSIMPAVAALETAATKAVLAAIPQGHQSGIISVDEATWDSQQSAFDNRELFFDTMMPTDQDAINLMNAAYNRLKRLGWKEAVYCPKDGSSFEAIEPGSTGIHQTHYDGEWPNGHWWVAAGGDLWPSRPCLYRPTEAEKTERERRIAAFRAQATNNTISEETGR